MKKTILTATAILVGLSTAAHSYDASVDTAQLVKVDNGALEETWVHPNADFSKFTKVMIVEGDVQFRDVKKQSTQLSQSRNSQSDFWVSDQNKAQITSIINKAFGDEIMKLESFEMVDTQGPDVLVFRGGLLDVVSHIPADRYGRGSTFVTAIGTATVVLEALDGETGEVIFTASERKKIEPRGRNMVLANSVQVGSEVRRWANRMAAIMVDNFDGIQS